MLALECWHAGPSLITPITLKTLVVPYAINLTSNHFFTKTLVLFAIERIENRKLQKLPEKAAKYSWKLQHIKGKERGEGKRRGKRGEGE